MKYPTQPSFKLMDEEQSDYTKIDKDTKERLKREAFFSFTRWMCRHDDDIKRILEDKGDGYERD